MKYLNSAEDTNTRVAVLMWMIWVKRVQHKMEANVRLQLRFGYFQSASLVVTYEEEKRWEGRTHPSSVSWCFLVISSLK